MTFFQGNSRDNSLFFVRHSFWKLLNVDFWSTAVRLRSSKSAFESPKWTRDQLFLSKSLTVQTDGPLNYCKVTEVSERLECPTRDSHYFAMNWSVNRMGEGICVYLRYRKQLIRIEARYPPSIGIKALHLRRSFDVGEFGPLVEDSKGEVAGNLQHRQRIQ